MLEPIVEGGGVLAGLALLLYFQVLRPDARTARDRPASAPTRPAPADEDRTDPEL